MCGITGIFNVDGRPAPIQALRRMTDVVRHRGPDGEGFWTDSFVGFGHRRLAIIDLSPLGHQPMRSEDGALVIAYNGEIYNFRELRAELEAKGHRFRSRTDTEVLLGAYREWGPRCVERLNGMFAFAVWDARQHRLFLARDRYGIKPLYYWMRGGTFLFASEVKSLLQHPEVEVGVDLSALGEYFAFQNVLTDRTLFAGVTLLPPASTLTLTLGAPESLRVERYWEFDFGEDPSLDEEECAEELRRLFEQAVARQLVGDVEVGAYLSGGIDSGAVTCVAARALGNLKTFTGGFDLSSASGLELACDERQKAEFLSNRYKTEHYEVVLKAGDMERVMPSLVWHLEDLRVGQSYPNYYVSRLASRFVKVVLSGAGGDELFAGYPWRYYRAAVNDDAEQYVEKYFRYWQRLVPEGAKGSFFHPDLGPGLRGDTARDAFRAAMGALPARIRSPEEYVNLSLGFESRTFLHGLLLVEDKLSMAHGLETRVPFLDNDLVDFARRVPMRYKLRDLGAVVRIDENEVGKTAKYFSQTADGKLILRKALGTYLPPAHALGAKQGFSAPDASWFKGESIAYIRDLLCDPGARVYDYIRPGAARALLDDHFQGRENRRLLIWSLLCFEWWCRTFLAPRPAPSALPVDVRLPAAPPAAPHAALHPPMQPDAVAAPLVA